MGPSVSGERGIALKDISGCRACPEDVSTWRKCKRDPVLAVPLSLPRGAYCWERFPSPAGRVRLCQLQCLVFSPSAGIPSTCTLICFGLTSALLGRVIRDRKSTRLNSSHGYISYAVFCLKKKKQNDIKRYLVMN